MSDDTSASGRTGVLGGSRLFHQLADDRNRARPAPSLARLAWLERPDPDSARESPPRPPGDNPDVEIETDRTAVWMARDRLGGAHVDPPRPRMKTGHQHVVPLSDAAVVIPDMMSLRCDGAEPED
jgi:hypothetical protein